MADNDIVITQWEKTDEYALAPNVFRDDEVLSNAIVGYYNDKLEPLGLKCLQHKGNVIVTDVLVYGAFYEKELKHAG